MVEQLDFHTFGFEKLEVWQKSIDFCQLLYSVSQEFPKEEIYGLSCQIKRAVISISSNIAEGSVKNSLKDQARFSEIAYGSLMEVINQLILAKNLGYLSNEIYTKCRNEAEILSRLINAYRNSQLRRLNEK